MEEKDNDKKNSANYWKNKLGRVTGNKYYQRWLKKTDKIVSRYCGESFNINAVKKQLSLDDVEEKGGYNLLFRNVKVRMPYLLPYIPSVVVERTNKDEDTPAKYASLLLERLSNNIVKKLNLDDVLKKQKFYAELYGWSTPWLRFEQKIATRKIVDDVSLEEIEEQYVESEGIEVEFVNPKDLFFDPQKTTEKIKWVAHRVYLTLADFKERFPEKNPDDYSFGEPVLEQENEETKPEKSEQNKIHDDNDVCEVYEIWDKISKKIYTYSPVSTKGSDELLKVEDYPCDIDFPCPMPLCYDEDPKTVYVPSRHSKYLTQYVQVDNITDTINKIIPTLWVNGLYAKDLAGVEKAFNKQNENAMVGIKFPEDLAAKYPGATLKDFIFVFDRKEQIEMLDTLFTNRELLVNDIQRGLGIIGLMEGQTNVQEGVQTNKIKGSFGTLWIQDDQKCVADFLVRFFKLYLTMASQLYDPQTLMDESLFYELEDYKKYVQNVIAYNNDAIKEMPQNPFDEAINLIQNNYMRNIRLDIATEDTKSYVDAEYKGKLLELQTSVLEGLQNFGAVVDSHPEFAPVFKAMFMATVRAQRIGKTFEAEMENAINFAVESIQKRLVTPPEQPAPDPTLIEAAKIEAAGKQEVAKIEAASKERIESAKIAAEYDKTGSKVLTDAEIKMRKLELEQRKQDITADKDSAEIAIKQQEADIKQQAVDVKKQEAEIKAANVVKDALDFAEGLEYGAF